MFLLETRVNATPQEEAVSENLKNMLLVMSNGGFLAPPDEKPELEDLWKETWKRINRFLPGLYGELFPDEVQGRKEKVVVAEGMGKGSGEVERKEERKEEEGGKREVEG